MDVFTQSRLSKGRKIVDKIKGTNRGTLYEVVDVNEKDPGNQEKKCKNTRCRDYAMRMYDASSSVSRNGIAAQFIRQVQGYALCHRNLLQVYDIDMVFHCEDFLKKDCRTSYLLILYELSSGNLEHWLDIHKPGADIFESVKLIHDITQALNYLHQEHYVHRRLHPSNILMVEEVDKNQKNHFIAKLGDFQDLSIFYTTEKDNPLPVNEQYSHYYAPEILGGYHHYLPSADMWALGILIYEIILGKGANPFYTPQEDTRLFKTHQKKYVLQKIFETLGTPPLTWRQKYLTDRDDFSPHIGKSVKEHLLLTRQKQLKATGFLEKKSDVHTIDMLMDLMNQCLCVDPEKRITAEQALQHPVFQKYNLVLAKSTKAPIPKTPCFVKNSRVSQIRQDILRNAAHDIELGISRYYPTLMAIYIFDRVMPSEESNSTLIYHMFCAAYLLGMKLLVDVEHPEKIFETLQGVVCGKTEAERLSILHLERWILRNLQFKLYPNEISTIPVTMRIFQILEQESFDSNRIRKQLNQ
jgi:serine/threonine protein kinase